MWQSECKATINLELVMLDGLDEEAECFGVVELASFEPR